MAWVALRMASHSPTIGLESVAGLLCMDNNIREPGGYFVKCVVFGIGPRSFWCPVSLFSNQFVLIVGKIAKSELIQITLFREDPGAALNLIPGRPAQHRFGNGILRSKGLYCVYFADAFGGCFTNKYLFNFKRYSFWGANQSDRNELLVNMRHQ